MDPSASITAVLCADSSDIVIHGRDAKAGCTIIGLETAAWHDRLCPNGWRFPAHGSWQAVGQTFLIVSLHLFHHNKLTAQDTACLYAAVDLGDLASSPDTMLGSRGELPRSNKDLASVASNLFGNDPASAPHYIGNAGNDAFVGTAAPCQLISSTSSRYSLLVSPHVEIAIDATVVSAESPQAIRASLASSSHESDPPSSSSTERPLTTHLDDSRPDTLERGPDDHVPDVDSFREFKAGRSGALEPVSDDEDSSDSEMGDIAEAFYIDEEGSRVVI